MHEMGIATEIVKIAISSIPDELKNIQVKKIHLKIGKMSAVVPSSLRFCFAIATKETSLDGAKLEIEEVPVVGQCNKCGNKWTLNSPTFTCDHCGSKEIDILSGQELEFVSLEVADELD